MDSFFGIGIPELVMILLLAGLVLGPQRIRAAARFLGRFIAQVQKISREFTRQLNAELDALDTDEVKGAIDEVRALRQEMAELRRQVISLPDGLAEEGRAALSDGEQLLKGTNEKATEADNGTGTALPRPVDVPDDPEI